jgi:hypothetical protein
MFGVAKDGASNSGSSTAVLQTVDGQQVYQGETQLLDAIAVPRKRSRVVDLAPNLARIGGYEIAPENLQEWIRDAGATAVTFSTEAGRRIYDYNILRVAAVDVKSTDIGLAAVAMLDEGELRDMDFMASSNILFYEFIGSPGITAYVKCLGYLGDTSDGSALTDRRFTLSSPTHFLIAVGDFLAIAAQVKEENTGRGKGTAGEPKEKRLALRAQDTGGERSEGERGGNYYIITRDGVRLPTRDKSNLQVRCDHLEFMWRAADRGLWKYIAGSGYKLQSEAYWKVVLEESEMLQQPEGSVFQRAGKVSLISGTAIAKNIKTLELFLRGEFGDGDLSLDSFCTGAKLSTSAHPCTLQNGPLISAMEALGISLEVLFSVQFAGVCDDLIEILRGHTRPLKLTDAGFLNHTVERVLIKFFRVVSKEEEAHEVPGSDIKSPAGCARLLKTMLAEMVRELVDVSKATVLEKNYTVLVRLRKERPVTATAAVKTRLKVRLQDGAGATVEQCGSHLGQLMKAVKKSGTPLKCAKGGECKYKHGKLSDLTKKSASDLIDTMPGWLQECLSPLVATCKGLKP